MEWRKSLACALALAGMMAFGPGVRQAALAADTHNLTILGGGSGACGPSFQKAWAKPCGGVCPMSA